MTNENETKNSHGAVFGAGVVLALLSMAALVWSMAGMVLDRSGSVEAGAHNARVLWPFWIASASGWIGLTAMWWVLRGELKSRKVEKSKGEMEGENSTSQQVKVGSGRAAMWWMLRREETGEKSPSRRAKGGFGCAAVMIVVVAAIAARVAVIVTHDPAISDDVYRYIFEGRNLAAGMNPYLVHASDRRGPPVAAAENWPGERELVDTPAEISWAPLVTYGHMTSPYLAVSHGVFGALGLVIRMVPEWSDPLSSARVFRVGFVMIEMVAIGLLLVACRRAGRSAWWVALYAWHPLAISEIAGSGHQDVIGIVLMIGALLAYSSAPKRIARWTALATCAVLVKPVAGAAAAMMLRRTPMRDWPRSAMVAAPVALAIVAPLWFIWGGGLRAMGNWKSTVDLLAERWAHFGGVYEGVLFVVQKAVPAAGRYEGFNLTQEIAARQICLGVLLIVCLAIFIKAKDVWRGTAAILLMFVLLTPMAHPWYMLWAFALFPLADMRALWVLSLTLPWGYVVFINGKGYAWGEEFTVQPWVLVAAYVPVLAALTLDVIDWRRRLKSDTVVPVQVG